MAYTYEQLIKKGATPVTTATQKEEKPGYFQRVGQQYKQSAEDIIGSVKRGAGLIEEGMRPGTGVLGQTSKTYQGVARAALGPAGAFTRSVFAPLTELIKPVVEPVVGYGVKQATKAQPVRDAILGIEKWAERHPDAAANLKDVVDIASGLALQKQVNKLPSQAFRVVEKTGKTVKGIGERAYRITAAPLTEAKARAVSSYQASQPTLTQRLKGYLTGKPLKLGEAPVRESETAARRGVMGTTRQIGVQSERLEKQLWKDIVDPSLKSYDDNVNMKEFFREAERQIKRQTSDLTKKNALLEALNSIKDDYRNVSSVSLSKFQNYKAGWAKYLPEKVFKGKPIAGAANEVRSVLARLGTEKVKNLIPSETAKQAYIDYGNLISLKEMGIKSADALRSKSAFRQIWELALDAAITPITSTGGKVIYQTGKGIQFIGEKGAKVLGDIIK